MFCVSSSDSDFNLMENYEPFRCQTSPDEVLFNLQITDGNGVDYTEELRQDEEGQLIICGRTPQGQSVFEFCWYGTQAGWLLCGDDFHTAKLIATGDCRKLAIDNALMVLYALATATHGTALFHAAVVSYRDHAYMFLGTSGTGKSTHAGLWLQHIAGTERVNDDNPVVRLHSDGSTWVYGSPWSGKTPCYRNVSYPLGALVMLRQAPYNDIQRLTGIEAYSNIIPSISGMRWDETIADGLHETENKLAMTVPTWLLDCLPDREAALTCQQAIAP